MTSRSQLGATLGLKVDHIPQGRPNRPGTPMMPNAITIHNTDNPNMGADAEAHARFVSNTGYYVYGGKKRYISWHYTVDDDSCIRHLPLNEVGFHAGSASGNRTSIGIEICMNEGIDQARAFDRAQRLVACLCYDLGFSVETDIKPHMHWSGKKCPSLLLDNGQLGTKWNKFLEGIQRHLDSIEEVDGV